MTERRVRMKKTKMRKRDSRMVPEKVRRRQRREHYYPPSTSIVSILF